MPCRPPHCLLCLHFRSNATQPLSQPHPKQTGIKRPPALIARKRWWSLQRGRGVGIPNPTKYASTATASVAGESTTNSLPRTPRLTFRPWKQIPSPRSIIIVQYEEPIIKPLFTVDQFPYKINCTFLRTVYWFYVTIPFSEGIRSHAMAVLNERRRMVNLGHSYEVRFLWLSLLILTDRYINFVSLT